MFGGKSTELVRLVRRFRRSGVETLLINHASDTRYTQAAVATHDRTFEDCVAVQMLADVLPIPHSARVVAVDEVHFFSADDMRAFYERVVVERGLTMICAGLTTTWQGEAFPIMSALLPLADEWRTLTAICEGCKGEATCSARQQPPSTDAEGSIEVGGAQTYWPACRRCWLAVRGAGSPEKAQTVLWGVRAMRANYH